MSKFYMNFITYFDLRLLIISITMILFSSCKTVKVSNSTFRFSGKITNHLGKDGFIRSCGVKKLIKIGKDGSFDEIFSLSKKENFFTFSDGNEFTEVFFKNGYDIYVELDTKAFDETIKYTGAGSETSNYLAQKFLFDEKELNPDDYNNPDCSEMVALEKLDIYKDKYLLFINSFIGLDPDFKQSELEMLNSVLDEVKKIIVTAKLKKYLQEDFIGKPSPKFENYRNYNGSKSSLSDFLGSYVYIDIWATWCSPCKKEIPHLKKLIDSYKDDNITFVSISVDYSYDKRKWEKMIKKEELGGIQLFAKKNFDSDFFQKFDVNSIPRFIFIDDKGVVIDANAPRPSNHEGVKELFSVVK